MVRTALPRPGSVVWIRQQRWLVARARTTQDIVRVDVANRDLRRTFLVPFDAVFPSQPQTPRRVRPQHALARLAGCMSSACRMRLPLAAISAHIDLYPYQLEPVVAMLRGRRRMLIADEVGLGKTIQAGLILTELRCRLPLLRALVIVPAALIDQWNEELASRFSLASVIASRNSLERIARAGTIGVNAWQRPGVWIASLDFLKQQHVMAGLPRRPWDVVVIDEAHDTCGESARYDAASSVCCRSRRVVLLTATPHDGVDAKFKRLLALGRLPEIDDDVLILRRTRADIGLATTRRVRWHRVRLSIEEQRTLQTLREFEGDVATRATQEQRGAARLLAAVFRKRALSTMGALDRSLERRLAWLDRGEEPTADWFQPSLEFGTGRDDIGDEERGALSADIGIAADRERSWLRRLRTMAQRASSHEAKIARLVALVSRSREPVVVFTEFRHSLELIERALGPVCRVTTLHGGQSAEERVRNLAAFLGQTERPSSTRTACALLATDVAGQGLNLQSRARWVVCVELPWNPARLEQRIGRVDRIGQTREVHATLLVARHPDEKDILVRLQTRVRAATRTLAGDALAALHVPADASDGSASPSRSIAAATDGPEAVQVPSEDSQSSSRETTITSRAARATCRVLTRRQQLAAHWRAPTVRTSAPFRSDLRTRVSAGPDGGTCEATDGLAIFLVPILDACGTVIEEHLAVTRLCVGEDRARSLTALADASRPFVLRRMRLRLTRLNRAMSEGAVRQALIDRAITRHFATSDAAASQRTLFRWANPTSPAELDPRDGDLEGDDVDRVQAEGVQIDSPQLLCLLRTRR